MGCPRAAAAPLVARFPARPRPVRPPYVTSALCRGMTVQPQAAAAEGGHGRRGAGRSAETFLTSVSIIEMRPAPGRARAVSFRPTTARIRSRPRSLTGRHYHGCPAAAGGPPAGHARPPGGATVGGWQIVRVRCW